jgi:hypothetical protein
MSAARNSLDHSLLVNAPVDTALLLRAVRQGMDSKFQVPCRACSDSLIVPIVRIDPRSRDLHPRCQLVTW